MSSIPFPKRRPAKARVREWLAAFALLAYAVVLVLATLSPTPLDQDYEEAIRKLLAALHRAGGPEWFGYNKLEFTANILMFVPLGFLIAMSIPTKLWWMSILIGSLLSGAIELAQGAFLAARFASLNDVVSNSAGAALGALFAAILVALVHQRDRRELARALWDLQQPKGPGR